MTPRDAAHASDAAKRARVPLGRVALLALETGALGFGGAFAVMARVRRRVVEDHSWLEDADVTELTAVASALPGAMAANLFTLIGHRIAGLRGALVAAVAFILPSAALMVAFGALYDHLRASEWVRAAFAGMNPAVVGVVAAVAIDMRKDALRSVRDAVVAGLAALALITHVLSILEVVVLAGVLGVLATKRGQPLAAVMPLAFTAFPVKTIAALFLVFAKIGSVTFGGGVAMIPAIAHEAIGRGWTDAQGFADAIALGQITPGPVAISATFIGYRAAGPVGALSATLGVLIPPFAITVVAARSLSALRDSRVVRGLLRGIAPAVVGLVVAATYALASTSLVGPAGVAIAVGSFLASVFLKRMSPAVPILAGAAIGVLSFLTGRA